MICPMQTEMSQTSVILIGNDHIGTSIRCPNHMSFYWLIIELSV